jgi:hypothetical protein
MRTTRKIVQNVDLNQSAARHCTAAKKKMLGRTEKFVRNLIT